MLARTIHRSKQLFRRPKSRSLTTGMSNIPHDVRVFLAGYPDVDDDPTQNKNLEFYSNKRRCQPDGVLIDEIHEE